MHFQSRITTLFRYIELALQLLLTCFRVMISIGMASLFIGSMMWLERKEYGFLAGRSFFELWGMAAIGTISAVVLTGFFILVFFRIPSSWRAGAHRATIFFTGTVAGWFGIIEKWVAATTPVLRKIDVFYERSFLRVIFCIIGATFVVLSIMVFWDGLWMAGTWFIVAGFFTLFVSLKWKSFTWENIFRTCRTLLWSLREKISKSA